MVTLGGRILLVEDSAINQVLALALLINNGLRATLAGNAQQALDALQPDNVDGVLMDAQMPVMDGYIAVAGCRKQLRFKLCP